MSVTAEEDFKRRTAKRTVSLVMDIGQGETSITEASRSFDLPLRSLRNRPKKAKRGMENALRPKPLDIAEQYERQLKELQETYGEAMLELRSRKKLDSLLGGDEK